MEGRRIQAYHPVRLESWRIPGGSKNPGVPGVPAYRVVSLRTHGSFLDPQFLKSASFERDKRCIGSGTPGFLEDPWRVGESRRTRRTGVPGGFLEDS